MVNVTILSTRGMSNCGASHSASLGYKFVFLRPSSLELCGFNEEASERGQVSSCSGVGPTKS